MSLSLKSILFALLFIPVVLLLSSLPVDNHLTAFHSSGEREMLYHQGALSMIDTAEFFATSGLCENCHSRDSQLYAQVDTFGNDINVIDDWKATMMANSARDPFWRAKVSHEILVNPSHAANIETSCTSCHAPLGNHRARLRGAEHYLISDMLQDTFGIDGVSCGACHHQSEEELGQLNSGHINWDTSRVIYGPYLFPFEQPMELFVGFKPVWSEHINDAGLCASCHTLIVESLDLDGNPTGTTFVEQATYHEWLNSVYNTDDVSCQKCHIPQLDQKVVIADGYGSISAKTPFGLHEMAGANTMMLKLMKENRLELGIPASTANFDSTLNYTFKMLQEKTLDLDLALTGIDMDSVYFSVGLTNKAGHKFPSGYPSRRAFVEFVVLTETGDTLFQSGVLDNNYEVKGQDPHYEPHYQTINQSEQVQIYQLVNGDVNGQFSTVLERGFQVLKDNRLPPLGFSTSHAVYDTTQIAGMALTDPDFNIENSMEGSGKDIVHYHIPLNGYAGGNLQVSARVLYQSLPPKWMAEMFGVSSPEIDKFKAMYEKADRSAVVIASQNLKDIYVKGVSTKDLPADLDLVLVPNPSMDGWVNLQSQAATEVEFIQVYNALGQWMQSSRALSFQLPEQKGLYLVKVYTKAGWKTFQAVRL